MIYVSAVPIACRFFVVFCTSDLVVMPESCWTRLQASQSGAGPVEEVAAAAALSCVRPLFLDSFLSWSICLHHDV
jgi:hypothetical protein